MSSGARHVVWIEDDDAGDPSLTGAKFARLAELSRWPEPVRPRVPDGFALSTSAWRRLLEHNGLDDVRPTASQIRAADLPTDLRRSLEAALTRLASRSGVTSLAVRSSSPDEDGRSASHAGQFVSSLGVEGVNAVVEAYLSCCSSALGAGVEEYRRRLGSTDAADTPMAVVVQPMVHEGDGVTGVVFSEHPHDPRAVLIEAVRGSGELLGLVVPDRYLVRRDASWQVEGPSAGPIDERTVSDLAQWSRAAEERLGVAVDVEFAVDRAGVLHVLQLRPLTSSGLPPRQRTVRAGAALVTGLSVLPGRAEGPVCRIDGPEEVDLLTDGAVLVTQSTDPRWLPLLGRVAAVVTDHGGLTSHAAIVCRELGILAVVGCGDATRVLRQGRRVVVTGETNGRGSVEQVEES